MIDWALAARVGAVVSGGPGPDPPPGPDLGPLAVEGQQRVADYTGLRPLAALPSPEPVDRGAWLEANLATMRSTMAPVADRLAERASGPMRPVAGALLGAEVGALVGLFSQRVLGQYDVRLLEDAGAVPHDPRLLLVAPNLGEAARRMRVDHGELVAWVVVHEVTHAIQFSAVPWLRDHIGGLLRGLLESLDVRLDPGALLRLPGADDVRGLVDAVREGGLVRAVAGPRRRDLLDRVQATMALVEGHAEHVMDAVGEEMLPSVDRLRAALDERRRDRPTAMRLLERVLGLDLKLRQYADGRRFCDAVVERGGVATLNLAWSAPERLPSAEELAQPEAWLARVA